MGWAQPGCWTFLEAFPSTIFIFLTRFRHPAPAPCFKVTDMTQRCQRAAGPWAVLCGPRSPGAECLWGTTSRPDCLSSEEQKRDENGCAKGLLK